MNVELIVRLVDALHGADVNASLIFRADARLRDDMGHESDLQGRRRRPSRTIISYRQGGVKRRSDSDVQRFSGDFCPRPYTRWSMPLDPHHVALELFEYKMDDLRNRRPVRGGSESLWELRRELDEVRARLDPEQIRRFDELSRELGQRETARPTEDRERAALDFSDLVLGGDDDGPAADTLDIGLELDFGGDLVVADDDAALASEVRPLTAAERAEQEALQRLAQRVFGREIERFAEGVAAGWRAERERVTARLLYATMRNYERYRDSDAFVQDSNLRQFTVVEAIPDLIDPLVSLSDVDSLVVIARDVIDAVRTLRERSPAPRIDRASSLDYVRRMALAVARDPYAGERSAAPPHGPSASELRSALSDLARQRLPDWQRQSRRQDLEARLRERQELERSQLSLLRRDQSRFASHIEAFFARLEQLLPRSVGGAAEEPQLNGGVLFAVSPALRKHDLSADVTALTVRTAGPVRLPFAGRDLVVTVHANERHLYVGTTEIPLDGDRVARIGDDEIETFVEGEYVHVRLRESGGSLAARVAAAATVLHVLAGRARDERLAVLRMIAPGAPGSPNDLVAEALRRAGQIVAPAPDPRGALAKLVHGASRATGIDLDPAWLAGFVERAHLAVTAGPDQLDEALLLLAASDPSGEPPQAVPFLGDPVDVTVGGRTVTVRRYGIRGADHLVAMLPGQVIGSFREHLIERLGAGTFVCVHGEQQLVVAFLPNLTIESRRDV